MAANGCGPFKSLVSWRMASAIRAVSSRSQLSERLMPARSYWNGNFGQSRVWNRLEALHCL